MNYLNTRNPIVKFDDIINDYIYVDKSLMIEKVSKQIRKPSNKYICITRPRRFGKTINANMLAAYYTKGYDSHKLFENLMISNTDNYQKHLNKHNVIYIDFSELPNECKSYDDYIQDIYESLSQDICKTYQLNRNNYSSLARLLNATEDSFIFILDEWDSIFYQDFMSDRDKNSYLLFLKGLLKDKTYVELAYMTGVLPIAKYSSGSELNMFLEYNFMNDHIYESYFGFSEAEVRHLCSTNQSISYNTLKYWYDGYHYQDGSSLFNPRSVNNALNNGVCLNYWTETGPMNEIANYIEHNVDEVREDIVKLVAGIPIEIKLRGYSASQLDLNTRDEILSAMVVFGFLSYHDGFLTIPNHELMEKFEGVLDRPSMQGVKRIVDQSKMMLEATLSLDERKVVEILE